MSTSRADLETAPPGKRVRAPSPSSGRPIDLVHLARQTCGDRALETEILQLMHGQVRLLAERLHLAGPDERRGIAHAMRGAARNVGAFTLAGAAERLEAEPWSDGALIAFRAEADAVRAFIAALETR